MIITYLNTMLVLIDANSHLAELARRFKLLYR